MLTEVLPQNPVKSRSREIGSYSSGITKIPVKLQSDWKKIKPESRGFEILEILL